MDVIWRLMAMVFFAIVPASAFAQAAAAPVGCELHVWGAAGLNSIYSGWFHGGIVNGAVTGREGYPAVSAAPLDTANQIDLLRKAGLPTLLQHPDYRLIVHDTALSSRTIRTTASRIDPSTTPCYAEFIVDDVFFQQDVVDGSFLKILFRYRDFGTEAAPRKVFGTWVKTKLLLLPPTPATDMTAASEELRAAFSNDVRLFAASLAKPAKAAR